MAGLEGLVLCGLLVPIAALGVWLDLLRESIISEIDDVILFKYSSLSFLEIPFIVVLMAGANCSAASCKCVSTCLSR